MSSSLEGRIEDLGVAELLYVVGVSRRSGLLRLAGATGDFEVLFREGAVIAARDTRQAPTLRALLVRKDLVDGTHFSVLERQAAREGRPLVELLEAEGVLPGGRLDELFRQEVQAQLERALEISEGTFAFDLLQDGRETAGERFGGLVLEDGVLPGKLPAVAERSGTGGLGGGLALPRSQGGRQAHLLVDDSSISLPALPESEIRRRGREATREAGGRPIVLLAIGWPALGRRLQPRLEAAGRHVLRPRSGPEVGESLLHAAREGLASCVIADVSLSAAPGLEILARAKLASRGSRTILLLDRRSTPAQLATHRERAARLGVTHVLVPSAAEGDDDAEAVVEEILELVLAPEPRDEQAAPEPIQALAAEATGPPDWMKAQEPAARRLASRPMEFQDGQLASRLRGLASLRRAAELAAQVLETSLEYAPRVTLFLPTGDVVRPFGVGVRDSAEPPGLAERLRCTRLPAGDADLPCASLRDARIRRVPGALAGAGLVHALGGARPRQVAAIPLLSGGTAVAVVVLDDCDTEDLPDLSALERFLAGLGPAFAESLERDSRRAAVRRLRAAP